MADPMADHYITELVHLLPYKSLCKIHLLKIYHTCNVFNFNTMASLGRYNLNIIMKVFGNILNQSDKNPCLSFVCKMQKLLPDIAERLINLNSPLSLNGNPEKSMEFTGYRLKGT